MTDRQHQKLNDLLRQSRPTNKVSWTPEGSSDPADQAADRAALNRAIRQSSGWAEESADADDQPPGYSWQTPRDKGR